MTFRVALLVFFTATVSGQFLRQIPGRLPQLRSPLGLIPQQAPLPIIQQRAPLQLIPQQLPIARIPAPIPIEEDGPAEYQFQYEVNDPITGDAKNQQEERLNDAVKGSYSLLQPDGLLRIVEYTANDAQGFVAVVRYEDGGIGAIPVPAPGPGRILAGLKK